MQPNLVILDVSYNHLITLNGLRALGRLKQLDVSWNKLIKSREEAAVLRKHTPILLKLDTRHNPWEKVRTLAKQGKLKKMYVKMYIILDNNTVVFGLF